MEGWYITEKGNYSKDIGGIQVLVFKRGSEWRWSYTARYRTLEGDWLQWSAGPHDYWSSAMNASTDALRARDKLARLLHAVTAKAKEPA